MVDIGGELAQQGESGEVGGHCRKSLLCFLAHKLLVLRRRQQESQQLQRSIQDWILPLQMGTPQKKIGDGALLITS